VGDSDELPVDTLDMSRSPLNTWRCTIYKL